MKRIYYIRNEFDGGYIYPLKIKYARSALGVVKRLCQNHLFDLSGYLKAVRKMTNLKYKIPVILSRSRILFQTGSFQSYETMWINFFEIKAVVYDQKGMVCYFGDGSFLKTELSERQFKEISHSIFNLLKYKERLE